MHFKIWALIRAVSLPGLLLLSTAALRADDFPEGP